MSVLFSKDMLLLLFVGVLITTLDLLVEVILFEVDIVVEGFVIFVVVVNTEVVAGDTLLAEVAETTADSRGSSDLGTARLASTYTYINITNYS